MSCILYEIDEAFEAALADIEAAREDVVDLVKKIVQACEDEDYSEALGYARAATRIAPISLGHAFDELSESLRGIADGADRMAEEALEHQRWRDYEG